jgi:hypothetical protein
MQEWLIIQRELFRLLRIKLFQQNVYLRRDILVGKEVIIYGMLGVSSMTSRNWNFSLHNSALEATGARQAVYLTNRMGG